MGSCRSFGRAPRRIFIALCVIAAGSCSTVANNTTPPPGARVVEAPDYTKQGGTWRYRVEHHMFTGGYRSDMDQGEYHIQMRDGKFGIARIENGKLVAPPPASWLHASLPTPKIIQEKEQFFNFPLWVGKKWSGAQLLGRWRDSHCTVTGIETIKTPAGSFQAYRIEREILAFVYEYTYWDKEVYFYSPETRSVVKYEYKRENKDLVGDPKYGLQETASYELLSYTPEPEKKDAKSAKAE